MEVERKEVYVSFEIFSEEVVDVGVNLTGNKATKSQTVTVTRAGSLTVCVR